jgi:Putative adhesin
MKRAINLTVPVVVLLSATLVQTFGACAHNRAAAGTEGHGAPAAVASAAPLAPQQSNDFRWRKAVAAGGVVEIKGVHGRVEAAPAAGGEVEVVAEKRARRSNPAGVRVEVVEHSEGVTICAVYPSPEGKGPNVCAPGDGGQMSVQNNDVEVNFTVRVPAGVRFRGRTVNGDVEALNLTGDVDAMTVNGSINVSTAGLASAKTVNGSITAAMGRADWSDELEFHTVNGGIELSLPAGLSTQVEVETLNGDIQTDFPMTVTGRFSKRHLTGTIGGGGRELNIKTINGSVVIRRSA